MNSRYNSQGKIEYLNLSSIKTDDDIEKYNSIDIKNSLSVSFNSI